MENALFGAGWRCGDTAGEVLSLGGIEGVLLEKARGERSVLHDKTRRAVFNWFSLMFTGPL